MRGQSSCSVGASSASGPLPENGLTHGVHSSARTNGQAGSTEQLVVRVLAYFPPGSAIELIAGGSCRAYLDVLRKESVEQMYVRLAEMTQVLKFLYGGLLEFEDLETWVDC